VPSSDLLAVQRLNRSKARLTADRPFSSVEPTAGCIATNCIRHYIIVKRIPRGESVRREQALGGRVSTRRPTRARDTSTGGVELAWASGPRCSNMSCAATATIRSRVAAPSELACADLQLARSGHQRPVVQDRPEPISAASDPSSIRWVPTSTWLGPAVIGH